MINQNKLNIERDLAKANQEISDLKTKNLNLLNMSNDFKKLNSNLVSDNNQLKNKTQDIDSERGKLLAENQKIVQQLANKEADIQDLSSKLSQQKEDSQKALAKNSTSNSESLVANQEIEKLRNNLNLKEKLSQSQNEQLSKLRQERNILEEKLYKKDLELHQLKAKDKDTMITVNNLVQDNEYLKKEKSLIDQEKNSLQRQLSELKAFKSIDRAASTDLDSVKSSFISKIEKINREKDALSEAKQKLAFDSREKDDENRRIKKQLKESEKKNTGFEEDIKAKQDQIAVLTARLAEREIELKNTRDLRSQNSSNQREISFLGEKIDSLQKLIRAKDLELEKRIFELDKAVTDRERFRELAAGLKDKNTALNESLTKAETRYEDKIRLLEEKINGLEETVSSRRETLKNLYDEVNQAKDIID